jgi:hypothetical protein
MAADISEEYIISLRGKRLPWSNAPDKVCFIFSDKEHFPELLCLHNQNLMTENVQNRSMSQFECFIKKNSQFPLLIWRVKICTPIWNTAFKRAFCHSVYLIGLDVCLLHVYCCRANENNEAVILHRPKIILLHTVTFILIYSDSAVGIATGYGLEDGGFRVWVPVGSRIFSSPRHLDRLWGPPSLLSNGYRELFPRG